ncbi:MAG TPA: hypothetical protein VFR58_13910 [Flavisolibacter sp.]|nr:hypothetical protein [Flavisolibacter sp.]
MAKNVHKGSELNNVRETWDRNEKERPERGAADDSAEEVPASNELERLIREEASDYDNENKEDQLLGGDRASLNDDDKMDEEGA